MSPEIQGGGVTPHEECDVYVDLIVSSLTSIENQHPQIADLFGAFAKHKQGEANFGYSEIGKDLRLHDSLSQTSTGIAFYGKLVEQVPAITVSRKILGDPDNTENVRVFTLAELNDNPLDIMDQLYAAIRQGDTEHGYVLKKIEYLNSIIGIKPGFFGLTIDINKILKEWLEKKRTDAPK